MPDVREQEPVMNREAESDIEMPELEDTLSDAKTNSYGYMLIISRCNLLTPHARLTLGAVCADSSTAGCIAVLLIMKPACQSYASTHVCAAKCYHSTSGL